ncbi:AAA family ATPase [Actinospica sp.]|uniref:AAA family ATPase n=1 Tax=Actinospica sp. TaxID=1872142 RepID=UPI002C351303|nr:AAA family ATPase [Actinospica sp.]HWG28499.1 AAA family ATPase [Actinospica sp.]
MATYAECLDELRSYLHARIPLIVLRSIEQSRAIRLVKELAGDANRGSMPFLIHTRATGLRDIRTNAPLTDDKSITEAMDYASHQFNNRNQGNFVFVDPDDLSVDSPFTRHFAEIGRLAENAMGSVIVITDGPLWSGLQRLGMTTKLDPPNEEEMYHVIAEFLEDNAEAVDISWVEDDARRAARFLVGATQAEAVNLVATVAAKRTLVPDDVKQLARLKDRIFSDLAGLEKVQVKESDSSIGGLQNLRSWLDRRRQWMFAEATNKHLRPPRGVLLVGVPGCGKSLSAKAIAAQWGLSLYRLDLANIMGQYVGQSESRLRDALEAADRIAPCVLWLDEIEKGLAGQSDSTGVTRRLIGQFLFWLQESTAPVFLVATSNDISTLPPELLRKGRFDEIFFVDLPDEDERAEILGIYYRMYVGEDAPEGLVKELVQLSAGFAGADIAAALHEVGVALELPGSEHALDAEFIKANFSNTMPLSRTNPEQIEEIRAWGRERAVPAGSDHQQQSVSAAGTGRRLILAGG